jgi:signal transduction histidine kinase
MRGVIAPKMEVFELGPLLAQLNLEFTALAHEKHLDFRIVGTNKVVFSDPHLLRRILQNFLSNAVRVYQTRSCVAGLST